MVMVKADGRRLLCGVALLAVVGMVSGMTRGAIIVEYTVEITDKTGTPISQADPNDEFKVWVYVKDLRGLGEDGGVWGAWADLEYNPDLVDWEAGTLVIAPFFNMTSPSGTIDEPNRLVDEAGGGDWTDEPGDDVQLLFHVKGRVHDPPPYGVVTFSLNQTEFAVAHETLVFPFTPVPVEDISYGQDTLLVVPEPATLCLLALGGIVALRRRRK